MQAISTQALSSRSATAGLTSRGKRTSRQPTRTVIAAAAKGNEPENTESQTPNKVLMSAVGALAAVSLAFGGPVYAQDPLPDSAESQGARAAVNKETDQAPSLTDIGKNFSQNVLGGGGGAGQAKDAAKSAADKAKNAAPDLSSADPLPDSAESQGGRDTVNKETDKAPSLTDIGKNFNQNVLGGGGGGSAKDAAQSAAKKAKNAAPDLSDSGSFERALKEGVFSRGKANYQKVLTEASQAERPFPDAITNIGKDQSALRGPTKQAKIVSASAGGQANKAAGKAKEGADSAKDAAKKGAEKGAQGAKKAAGKAKNAAPDLSQLPDVGGLINKAQGKVSGDIGTVQGKVKSDIGTAKGKVKSDIGTTGGKVKSDIGTAKNAAPDLSQLPDVGGLLNKAQGKVSGDIDTTKGKVKSDIGTTQGKVKGDIGTTKGKVKSDIGTAKNALPDLNQVFDSAGLLDQVQGKVSGDIDTVQGKVKSDIDTVQGKVKSDVGTAQGKVKSDIGTTKGKVKSDIGTAKNAAPDLSTAQLPTGEQLLQRIQGRENTFDALQRSTDRASAQSKKVKSDIAAASSKAGSKAQSAASSAKGKAKNAAPDLSFNPFDALVKEPQNANKDSQKSAETLQSTEGHDFTSGGGRDKPNKSEAKDLKKDYKQGSSDLPVPNVGADVDTGR